MRRKESIRKFGDIEFKRNTQLGYTQYKVERGDTEPPIEIYVSDEMRKHGKVPFKTLKDLAIQEIARVTADPYGETSIDPNVEDPTFRNRRAVNRVTDEVEAKIGFPIAIKSSAPACPENLLTQYKVMRALEKKAEKRLGDLESVIAFLPVYGAIEVGTKQFLIMDHVKNGKEIEDEEVPIPTYGWGSVGVIPVRELAFSAKEHPQLVAALNIWTPDSMVRWRAVKAILRHRVGGELGDLAGRNVLTYPSDQGKRYVIIDQVPQGRYA